MKPSIQIIKQQIPSYVLKPDDLNPMFDVHGRCLNPYPYTLQNGITLKQCNKDYEIVSLENQYLRVEVIPDLGGRVQRIYDKRIEKDVFYYNQEINPQLVGTRGAWFAGGIEFNTPISHSPTSFDRIHYVTEESDKSASIIFGGIEKVSSLYWEVRLTLSENKASLDQHVKIQNPTSMESRYYFWTNAAISDHHDLSLCFPFDWSLNHIEKYYMKWPMYEGVDYRKAGMIPHIYEAFGKLLKENFFGVYYNEENRGIVKPTIIRGAQ